MEEEEEKAHAVPLIRSPARCGLHASCEDERRATPSQVTRMPRPSHYVPLCLSRCAESNEIFES
ncbi:hypothetical protein E2C01_067340 [Portunus trituberculatus]|uniref:Uncharacterized protein n=1 Tax=Portunus trituberculatus TaxID=210409 RepID=A0A5B7HX70_PORTR|nr:hypothetical protein [Portunus trituberculatus]